MNDPQVMISVSELRKTYWIPYRIRWTELSSEAGEYLRFAWGEWCR